MGEVNRHIFTLNSYRVVVHTVMDSRTLNQQNISSCHCEDAVAKTKRIFWCNFLTYTSLTTSSFTLAEQSYTPKKMAENFH